MNRIDLLYQQYTAKMGSIIKKSLLSEREFKKRFIPRLEEMQLIELDASNPADGFLYYAVWTGQ